MTRLLGLCLFLTLITACKKSDSDRSSPASEPAAVTGASDTAGTQEAADSPAVGSDALAQDGAEHDRKHVEVENDGKVALEASMVERYVTYRRDRLAVITRASMAFRAAADEARNEPGVDPNDDGGEMDRAFAEALKTSGLTEAQVSAFNEIALEIMSSDVRAKYGDAVVDAMLEHREELERLDDEEDMLAQGNEPEFMRQEREELGIANEE